MVCRQQFSEQLQVVTSFLLASFHTFFFGSEDFPESENSPRVLGPFSHELPGSDAWMTVE